MLVATPGQTTSYLHSSVSKKICHNSAAAGSNINSTHKANLPLVNKLPESSRTASVASAFMKTLSVRLNRGNEYLKNAVQRALNPTSNADNSTTRNRTPTALLQTPSSKIASRISTSKLYTVPPTITHRYPQRRLSNCSTDSLCREMCHFKPIRSAPTTTWKCGSKSRGPSLKIPKSILATKVNLSMGCDDISDKYEDLIPRPITLAPVQFSFPSAFVFLDAQMKTVANVRTQGKRSVKKRVSLSPDLFEKRNTLRKKSKKYTKNESIEKEIWTNPKGKSRCVNSNAAKSNVSNPSVEKVGRNKRTAANEKKNDLKASAVVPYLRKRYHDNEEDICTKKQRCLRSSNVCKSMEQVTTQNQQRKQTQIEPQHSLKGSSPPLTRLRLKQKTNKKLNPALTFDGRPI